MRVLLTALIILLSLAGFTLYLSGGNMVDLDGDIAAVEVPCTIDEAQVTCDPLDARTVAWLEENNYGYSHLLTDTSRTATFKNGKRYLIGSYVYQLETP